MIIKKAMVYNITKIFVSRPVLKTLLMMMIITVVGLSFASCSKEKAEPERLVNVRVWSAETRRVQPYLETTGTLKPDEEVLVTTEAGMEEIELEITETSHIGHVMMPHGFGLVYSGKKYGANVNRLTKSAHRDQFGTPLHRFVPCRVEALSA